MITTIDPGRCLHVTGATTAAIEDGINVAVEIARGRSMREGWQGMLVTRHDPSPYTVALSAGVIMNVARMADRCPSRGQHGDLISAGTEPAERSEGWTLESVGEVGEAFGAEEFLELGGGEQAVFEHEFGHSLARGESFLGDGGGRGVAEVGVKRGDQAD